MHLRFDSLRPASVVSALVGVLVLMAVGCGTSTASEDDTIKGGGTAGSNSESDRVAMVDYTPGERVSDDFARGFLPDEWAGYAVGLPVPEVYYLYPMGVAESGNVPIEPPDEESQELLRTLSSEAGPSAMVTFREGHAYLIVPGRSEELHSKVEAMLDRAYDVIEGGKGELGEDMASGVGVSVQPLRVGTEDRQRMAIVDGVAAGADIRSAIGYLETKFNSAIEQCTGTVVSPQQTYLGDPVRAVLTSAHCVLKGSESPQTGSYFAPRADTAVMPTTEPFGRFSYKKTNYIPPGFMLVPDGGLHTCASNPNHPGCYQYDWAVVLYKVPSSPPKPLEHFMRYKRVELSELMGFQRLKMRGYPVCGESESPQAPDKCTWPTLYGTIVPCRITQPPDYFGTAVFHDCDANTGNSGTSIYTYWKQRATTVALHTSGVPSPAINVAPPVNQAMEMALDAAQSL